MTAPTKPLDSNWIKQSFLMRDDDISDDDFERRIYTAASQKFTDTTLGGNFVINPLPQFTKFADPKVGSKYSLSRKMGRFYSEVIDENKQVIHVRLGVPRFNSLTRFLGEFYNVEASSLARKGRGTSAFYTLGRLTGSIVSAPLMPVLLVGKMVRFLTNNPASRYYYLKPTMFPYWGAVASTVNRIAVNMGVIPRVMTESLAAPYYEGEGPNLEDAKLYHKLLPDIYREDGGIDVFALSTRAQRLANAFQEALENQAASGKKPSEIMRKMADWTPKGSVRNASLEAYRELYLNSEEGNYATVAQAVKEMSETEDRSEDKLNGLLAFYNAERKMGADFVSFRVDHTGTNTESFNTSTKEAGIAQTINGMSSGARAMRFNLADGNIDGMGLVSGITSAATDFLNGLATSLEIQGIAAVAGSAFVDIPHTWDSSTADINRTTLTIPLRSPYGNDMSRLMNLIIPMSMFLAMALPLSTGKQSYTSPFILELFNRGRTQIRLGMVESLSFTRGVGDVGWTNTGKFLGVDVNLTIVDLSKLVHMPLSTNYALENDPVMSAIGAGVGGAVGGVMNAVGADGSNASNTAAAIGSLFSPNTYDEDNLYSDYTATLGSLDLSSQIHVMRKLKLAMTRQMAEFNQWKSPARFASWSMENMLWGIPGDVIKAISMEGARE